jgi:catechol 2,3-dioxygenase-like lactoylglutathione lyase family enzyme
VTPAHDRLWTSTPLLPRPRQTCGSGQSGRVRATEFYGELLGLDERAVPPKLNPDELIWFRVGGDLELHLFDSNEPAPLSQDFCLRIDSGLDQLRRRLEDAGIETQDTDEIVGRPRFFCRDPFGNRVELTEWRGA